ncbi:hypothetical protein LTR85_006700 [Meristemomyces frigidus]|nr:hypothetical protein LTR85_006700 [Meristemomyces frigidus]
MATTTTTDSHDDYWKLDHHEELTAKQMRALLEEGRYDVGSLWEKDRLRHNEELRHLIKARKIDISNYTEGHRIGQRQDLMDSLDRDDMHPNFHRFMKLPAELRNQIYGYHLADFRKPIYAPSQPPLSTTCRLIRQEFLPLFYSTCIFEVRLNADKRQTPK